MPKAVNKKENSRKKTPGKVSYKPHYASRALKKTLFGYRPYDIVP